MRISGGTLRGRTVLCPPGIIRPAMDRMRESLFSILGPLQDTSFLDLFSGSGLVGLEAYSRGARPVVLVEKDRGKRKIILKNLADLPSPPRLCLEPVERYVARTSHSFDIIYLDPPFSYPYKEDLLLRIARSRLVREDTRILIHLPTEESLSGSPGGLERQDIREYGGSSVHFFSPSSPGNADT